MRPNLLPETSNKPEVNNKKQQPTRTHKESTVITKDNLIRRNFKKELVFQAFDARLENCAFISKFSAGSGLIVSNP